MEARNSPSYFETFYLRRIHRIFPIYFVWLSLYPVASFAFLHWTSSPLQVDPSLLHRLPFFYLFIQTLVPLKYGTLGWYWLAVTWSVAIEEQFYIIAAPVVRYLSSRRLVIGLILTIVACPVLRLFIRLLWPNEASLVYVLMPARADSLAIGMLVAWLWKNGDARLWLRQRMNLLYGGFAVLLMGAVIFGKWFPGQYTLFASLVEYQWLAVMYACLLLIGLVDAPGRFAGVMRWPFLRELGRLSYCIYLIHLTILGLCHAILLHSSRPRIDTDSGVAVTIFAAILTFFLAKLSWHCFEAPLVVRGHRYKYWASRKLSPCTTNESIRDSVPQPKSI